MNYSQAVVDLMWIPIVISFMVGIAFMVMSICLYCAARRFIKKSKKLAEVISKKTQNSFNKIATLSVNELNDYLNSVFSQMIALSVDKDISSKDPNNAIILYAKSLEATILYLGPETIRAIEYYYGAGFIERWCESRYFIMERNGTLAKALSFTRQDQTSRV